MKKFDINQFVAALEWEEEREVIEVFSLLLKELTSEERRQISCVEARELLNRARMMCPEVMELQYVAFANENLRCNS